MEKNTVKCKFHPDEQITNFCIQSGCFTQLCAVCICSHTQGHNRSNTKPKYQLIKKSFFNSREILKKINDQIDSSRSRISYIMQKIAKQKMEADHFLKLARQQAISTVHRAFDQIEHHYRDHLQHEKKKTGLMNENRFQQILSQLNECSQQVSKAIEELSYEKNCKIIKYANIQMVPSTRSYLASIAQQLSPSQQFHPNLTYRPGNLDEVASAVKRLFTTSVSYPVNSNSQYYRMGRSISKGKQFIPKTTNRLSREISIGKSSSSGKFGAIQLKSPRINQNSRYRPANTQQEQYYNIKDSYHSKMSATTQY